MCILKHPIENSNGLGSLQIIIPQKEVGRRHGKPLFPPAHINQLTLYPFIHLDIYISCVSKQLEVCPQGFYIAIVATTVETNNPRDELKPGLKLLQPIDKVFYSVSDLFEAADDGKATQVSFQCSVVPSINLRNSAYLHQYPTSPVPL